MPQCQRHRPCACEPAHVHVMKKSKISKTRTVLSADAEASRPSGLQAHEYTVPSCPSSLATSRPELTSHTRTVLSAEEEASWLPSGLHAHEKTSSRCPSSTPTWRRARTFHTRTVLSAEEEASRVPSVGLHAQQRTGPVCRGLGLILVHFSAQSEHFIHLCGIRWICGIVRALTTGGSG